MMDELLLDQIEQVARTVHDLRAPRRHVPKRVRNRVGDRDGWICRICHEPVDRDRPWIRPAPGEPFVRGSNNLYPSVEHLVPVGVGGTNDEVNLAICHLACNSLQTHPGGWQTDNFTAIRVATAATEVLKAVARVRNAGLDKADEVLSTSDLGWLVEYLKQANRSSEAKPLRAYLRKQDRRRRTLQQAQPSARWLRENGPPL